MVGRLRSSVVLLGPCAAHLAAGAEGELLLLDLPGREAVAKAAAAAVPADVAGAAAGGGKGRKVDGHRRPGRLEGSEGGRRLCAGAGIEDKALLLGLQPCRHRLHARPHVIDVVDVLATLVVVLLLPHREVVRREVQQGIHGHGVRQGGRQGVHSRGVHLDWRIHPERRLLHHRNLLHLLQVGPISDMIRLLLPQVAQRLDPLAYFRPRRGSVSEFSRCGDVSFPSRHAAVIFRVELGLLRRNRRCRGVTGQRTCPVVALGKLLVQVTKVEAGLRLFFLLDGRRLGSLTRLEQLVSRVGVAAERSAAAPPIAEERAHGRLVELVGGPQVPPAVCEWAVLPRARSGGRHFPAQGGVCQVRCGLQLDLPVRVLAACSASATTLLPKSANLCLEELLFKALNAGGLRRGCRRHLLRRHWCRGRDAAASPTAAAAAAAAAASSGATWAGSAPIGVRCPHRACWWMSSGKGCNVASSEAIASHEHMSVAASR
mmetsp:Transcript_30526/g.77224  ORF Transcript_30526/g.77224 Transcript_30526/m.77224 type:complete len:487 (-) Transcript_30526:265-1725(-)